MNSSQCWRGVIPVYYAHPVIPKRKHALYNTKFVIGFPLSQHFHSIGWYFQTWCGNASGRGAGRGFLKRKSVIIPETDGIPGFLYPAGSGGFNRYYNIWSCCPKAKNFITRDQQPRQCHHIPPGVSSEWNHLQKNPIIGNLKNAILWSILPETYISRWKMHLQDFGPGICNRTFAGREKKTALNISNFSLNKVLAIGIRTERYLNGPVYEWSIYW